MYFSKGLFLTCAMFLVLIGIFIGTSYDSGQVFGIKQRLSIPESVEEQFESFSIDYTTVTVSKCTNDGEKIYKVDATDAYQETSMKNRERFFDLKGEVMTQSAVHKDPSDYNIGNIQDNSISVSVLGASINPTDCQVVLSKTNK